MFRRVKEVSEYQMAVNKVYRDFNRREVWNHHLVQIYGDNILLPFCGTTADIMLVENAEPFIESIKNGGDLNEDKENPFCKRRIASILASGSDKEKKIKRIRRYKKRQARKTEQEKRHVFIKDLESMIIEKLLTQCPACEKSITLEQPGYLYRGVCETCATKWVYSILCQTDGSFTVDIDNSKLLDTYQTGSGNILTEEPFIMFSQTEP